MLIQYIFIFNDKASTLALSGRLTESFNFYQQCISKPTDEKYNYAILRNIYKLVSFHKYLSRFFKCTRTCFNILILMIMKMLNLSMLKILYHYLKGKCFKSLNRINEAIKCFDEVIEIDKCYSSAYFSESECLLYKKDYESA